ncbi:dynein axonemal assembly factor 6-like [Littorina saxatilis]|uniref:PIH1D1/2/3 CS-like domain-containing protein n=1 Tax=Littorina saxatilis TaxID=31220 RepID=A0AAN9G6P7_9CAEN
MSWEWAGADINGIANLLNIADDRESDSDEDMKPDCSVAALGPGDVGPVKHTSQPSSRKEVEKKNTKDIWDADEVPEGAEYETLYDPRPEPEYDIVFKQAVSSEDMFLQMGNRTPLTSSCEDMVVKIHLPNTTMADVELDVKPKFLDCRTPKYKLGLHLPHPVDDKNGKAQWNAKTESLHVTLRMTREFDAFNF